MVVSNLETTTKKQGMMNFFINFSRLQFVTNCESLTTRPGDPRERRERQHRGEGMSGERPDRAKSNPDRRAKPTHHRQGLPRNPRQLQTVKFRRHEA